MNSRSKATKKRQGRRRHVPQRTCIGCRTVRPKREMVRVIRTPEGSVAVDPSGKRAGRGAYLCPNKSCWEMALKRHSLDRALKATVTEQEQRTLAAFAAQLNDRPEIGERPVKAPPSTE